MSEDMRKPGQDSAGPLYINLVFRHPGAGLDCKYWPVRGALPDDTGGRTREVRREKEEEEEEEEVRNCV